MPTVPEAAQQVGRYRLLARIGEGGMGVVHLAQAPDGARVALKVLRPHIVGDEEARQRLAREVASLSRVSSPRVAEVIDAEPWGETPFVATRYIPGLTLHEHVRQEGPVRGEDLVFFAHRLAEAVQAVHRAGVLHRDIKPANVLLEGRAPVLIDFGLARLAEDPRLTQTGWLLGTPGYLAPEILYGEDATTASDVHSWAATVVFAALGRPPFGTGPAMAIMDRVRRGEHDLSGLPVGVLPTVLAALAPEPADRPDVPTLLAELGSVPPSVRAPRPVVPDLPTMPVALSLPERPQGTEATTLTPADAPPAVQPSPTGVLAEPATVAAPVVTPAPVPAPAPMPTRRLPVPPPHDGSAAPSTTRPAEQTFDRPPARAPYMQPPPPRQQPSAAYPAPAQRAALLPPDAVRPPPAGASRLRRGVLLAGAFATVTLSFAHAPYLTLVVVGVLCLLVRTLSWTTEAARERQHLRGRRRWYDGPLTLVSIPWYLVVATGGTLVLLVWSAFVAFTSAFAYLLFRGPLLPGMLLTGAVLALSLWWGPGARRLRTPTRRAARALAARPGRGWLAVGVVVAAAVWAGWVATHTGVTWDPQPGPPWRNGTPVGALARWL